MLTEDVIEGAPVEAEQETVPTAESGQDSEDAAPLDDEPLSTNDAPAAEPLPVEEYTTSGEGTASDGKGSTKKVFFIQKKKDEDAAAAPPRQWLRKMSDGVSSVSAAVTSAGAAAGEKMRGGSSMVKAAPASAEKSEGEPQVEGEESAEQGADEQAPEKKDRLKALVDSGRASVDAATVRLSGMMASLPSIKKDDADAAAPDDKEVQQTSRLAALRIAMGHLAIARSDKPVTDPSVALLKEEVATLKDTVQALADKLAALEAKLEQ